MVRQLPPLSLILVVEPPTTAFLGRTLNLGVFKVGVAPTFDNGEDATECDDLSVVEEELCAESGLLTRDVNAVPEVDAGDRPTEETTRLGDRRCLASRGETVMVDNSGGKETGVLGSELEEEEELESPYGRRTARSLPCAASLFAGVETLVLFDVACTSRRPGFSNGWEFVEERETAFSDVVSTWSAVFDAFIFVLF